MERFEQGEDAPAPDANPEAEQAASDIELDDYQKTVVQQAEDEGYSAYGIEVKLVEDCLLKSVRVYMVFEVLEDTGEIIESDPSSEDLEAENFENTFSIVLVSKLPADDIENGKTLQGSDSQKENAEAEDTSQENDQPKQEKTQNTKKQSKTIRVNSERIDRLMNVFEELVLDRGRLEDITEKQNDQELRDTVERISRISQDMQDLILSMRIVPVEQVFSRFPRMVRGLQKDLGKQIDLEITGADTKLDRTVIDEIGDPLVHLIRNSADHGIETPEERKQAGKPETGSLILRAYHSENHVFIEIEDDGSGIDREKVKQKAIDNGMITEDDADKLKYEDANKLIMASGFSTSEEVSDVSGRGVGLDAVNMTITSLGVIFRSSPR